jgi:2-oxoglutarate dehydrogenase E1 component
MNLQTMALYADNVSLLEEMYESYKQNPSSVDREWQEFFRQVDQGGFSTNGKNGYHKETPFKDTDASNFKEMGIINLLNAYRRQGHLAANLDPLGILKPDRKFIDQKLSNLKSEDLDSVIDSGISSLGKVKLKDIISWFEKTYCGSIGSEQYYIVNDEEREWLQNKMESTANSYSLNKNTKLRLFKKMYEAAYFEDFLARKFVGKKRFSLEGGDSLIPILDTIVEEAGSYGMEGLVIGMAHRGRLNVLVNVIEKPASLIFAEFEEKINLEEGSYADVKYHLGYSNFVKTSAGKEVKLSLAFNPSHLEAVNPVVEGSVRARQNLIGDKTGEKYMPILIHGDAAFAGQGVVAETLNLMNLEGYTTGGTFHIVVNNQIGFTTLPSESRSTLYATDLAKGFQIPIFHVNGDDPEACYRVVRLAHEYRQKFHKDVIIDQICYRRLGHNEMDEPAFTQPFMYNIIKNKPISYKLYEEQLIKEGAVSKSELDSIKKEVEQSLEDSFNETKSKDIKIKVDTMQGEWSKFSETPLDSEPATKLLKSQLNSILKAMTTLPSDFKANPKLVKLLEGRKKMGEGELPIDWGCAEHLSFGSILESGFKVRISGQDAQRGTFTHRHAVLVDTENGNKYAPLSNISPSQGQFEVINSSLSEYSVLGFEYGYSLANPGALVIWEAQFGDFANTAQVIFDQFISSSETKWKRMSGLVVLLPHGYEGQGPEHSSGRLERLLQLCAEENMQIANLTTPAQYFHLLRRQMLRNYRKPLVVMTPKSLLRLPAAVSNIDDLLKGAFKEVLLDKEEIDPKKVRKLLFCSGKVYYDLVEGRTKSNSNDVAILRLEQIYPFPNNLIKEALSKYSSAKEIAWVQEEPQNQGAWTFVRDFFEDNMNGKRLHYYGRKKSASPAAGHVKVHMKEQEALVKEALS